MRGLIVPGLNGSGAGHWQTLCEHKYQFDRVQQQDWRDPNVELYIQALDEAIFAYSDKVVIIAHGLGCWTVIHWAALHPDRSDRMQSALLVAPPDTDSSVELPKSAMDFTQHNVGSLPFASVLVGSENDPYMTLDGAKALAATIGSQFVNAGHVGHINLDSGHGHWTQGGVLRQLVGHSNVVCDRSLQR